MSNIIEQIEKDQMKSDVPAFAPGDTVVVNVKVKEGRGNNVTSPCASLRGWMTATASGSGVKEMGD